MSLRLGENYPVAEAFGLSFRSLLSNHTANLEFVEFDLPMFEIYKFSHIVLTLIPKLCVLSLVCLQLLIQIVEFGFSCDLPELYCFDFLR